MRAIRLECAVRRDEGVTHLIYLGATSHKSIEGGNVTVAVRREAGEGVGRERCTGRHGTYR